MRVQALEETVTGKERFLAFVRTLHSLLSEEEFDLVVGAGDSGIAMLEFTKFVYGHCGIRAPPFVAIPLYRDGDRKRNVIKRIIGPSREDVKKQLEGILAPQRILFVDDEIGKGNVARTALELVLSSFSQRKDGLFCTIVAEDHGKRHNFDPAAVLPCAKVRFLLFSTGQYGEYSQIFRFLVKDIQDRILHQIGNHNDNIKYAVNVFLCLPVKEREGETVRYTRKYLERAESRMPELPELRAEFREDINAFVTQALEGAR